MQCPKGCAQPCARDGEAAKNGPKQQGAGGVEGDIDEVIGQGIQAPKLVLEPKAGEDKRVVNCPGAGPDGREAEWADDAGVMGEVVIVIPDEAGVPNADVGEEDGGDEEKGGEVAGAPWDRSWGPGGGSVIGHSGRVLVPWERPVGRGNPYYQMLDGFWK